MIDILNSPSLMKNVATALPSIFASMKSNSLIEYSSPARVEPLCLVDMTLEGKPLADVMSTLTNIFSAYYLQAIALSNTIGSVTVMRRLDKLQPRRSISDNAVQTLALSVEQFSRKLPAFKNAPTPYHHASLEAQYPPKRNGRDNQQSQQAGGIGGALLAEHANNNNSRVSQDTVDSLREINNLATGKTMSVEIVSDSKTISVPVTVRLTPLAIASDIFVNCFSMGGFQNNPMERLWRWSTGELSAIGDMIFCNDLIDQHRKNLIQDKSGIYREVTKRKRHNKLAAALSGNPSIATISNIAIISESTALKWGRELGAPLSDFKQRERVFENSTLMILVVYDTQWDRVKIYYKSIPQPSELSLSDMKTIAKNSSPDILELIRGFTSSGKTGTGPIL